VVVGRLATRRINFRSRENGRSKLESNYLPPFATEHTSAQTTRGRESQRMGHPIIILKEKQEECERWKTSDAPR